MRGSPKYIQVRQHCGLWEWRLRYQRNKNVLTFAVFDSFREALNDAKDMMRRRADIEYGVIHQSNGKMRVIAG